MSLYSVVDNPFSDRSEKKGVLTNVNGTLAWQRLCPGRGGEPRFNKIESAGNGYVADFIKENRAVRAAGIEHTLMRLDRSGKSPFPVPE